MKHVRRGVAEAASHMRHDWRRFQNIWAIYAANRASPLLVSFATITEAAAARLRPNIERKRTACEMHQQPV